MTDLSSLFRSKTFMAQSPSSSKPFQQANYFQTQMMNPPLSSQFSSPKQFFQSPRADNQISISNMAKKLITYNSLQNEIYWFQSQNLYECGLKSFIIGLINCGLYMTNMISWNTTLTSFMLIFLMIGLQHCIFGANFFKFWACVSLFATTLTTVNEVFLSAVKVMSPTLWKTLYQTHHSLIPSLYISILIIIIVYSQSLLSQPSPTTLLHTFNRYLANLFQILKTVYKLKIALLQVYSILLILTFIVAYFLSDSIEEIQCLFHNIMHPVVLMAQVVTFWLFVIALDFALRIVSGTFTRYAVSGIYGKKSKATNIPIILQLLRVSYGDLFGSAPPIKAYDSKQSFLAKILRFDFSSFQYRKQRRLTREELENIYKHSLCWLKDLIESNPNALKTKINTSRFYNNYFDILKDFTQSELKKYSNSLFELFQAIESLNALRKNEKSLKQDLFYWFKVLSKQFLVWGKAVNCCRLLNFMDMILQILTSADLCPELWRQSSIGITLNQIRQKAQILGANSSLNPIIRQKMLEYYHKTNRILRTQ